jgi:hypothetical protein
LVYASGFWEFNFGPAQFLVFHRYFIFTAKIIYFVLGVWTFVSGVLFFKDWLLMRRGRPLELQADDNINPFAAGPDLTAAITTVILGLVLSALATLWPVNNYILLLGSGAYIKGQWQMVMPLLWGYIFTSMWPLWFVWAFISIKNLSPSLLKIVCSSIFITASSCIIFIFK